MKGHENLIDKELLNRKHLFMLFPLLIIGFFIAILECFGIAAFLPILQGTDSSLLAKAPQAVRVVFENLSHMDISQRFKIVAICMLVIYAVRFLLLILNLRLSLMIRAKIIKLYKMKAINRIMKVNINYFNKRKISDFHLVFEHYIEMCLGVLIQLICSLIPAIITVLFLVTALFMFSWKITIVALGFGLLSSYFISTIIKISQDRSRKLEACLNGTRVKQSSKRLDKPRSLTEAGGFLKGKNN